MIKSWTDFENWRGQSITYHKGQGECGYLNALTYFEHAREYFNQNGFPEQTEKYKNGKLKPWSAKDIKKQKEEINEFIKSKQFKKVQKRGRRK